MTEQPQPFQTVPLNRGEVLFLPPFWWHRVETTTDRAISVNAWSDAPGYVIHKWG